MGGTKVKYSWVYAGFLGGYNDQWGKAAELYYG